MKTTRDALLGACLVLPLLGATSYAQTTIHENGRTITVPPGAVVLIVPGTSTVAAAPATHVRMPQQAAMLHLIAQQQAAMQQMMAQMNAQMGPMFAPMPGPSQLFSAAFGGNGPMLAGGPGVCVESVSIVQNGNAAPVVTRSRSGCGAPAQDATHGVNQVQPAQPNSMPRLLKVRETPYPAPAALPPTLIAER